MEKQLIHHSASELAQLISSKHYSISEVLQAFFAQIESKNGTVNAISQLRPKADLMKEAQEKEAILNAGESVGPLFGVPVTIKESIMVQGLKHTNGDPMLRNNIAQEDALIVRKLKEAGAIVIGVTNLAFLSIDWQSANAWNGTTNNPHDLKRTAGGSSGGASAAVAAYMSPISIGSDAGGSIRVPAHFCGVYGLRPTENFISNRGHLKVPGKSQGRRHIVTPGPLANSLDDLVLSMQVLADYTRYPVPELPNFMFKQNGWNGNPLRIAYADQMNGVPIDSEYKALFDAFIAKLNSSSHQLEEAHPVYDERKAYLTNNKIQGFENGINLPPIPGINWLLYLFIYLKYRDHLWALGMAKGIKMSNAQYAKAIDYKDEFSMVYQTFLSEYDVWITPVCAMEAFPHQKAGKPFLINGKNVPYTQAIASYAFTSAFSGHPIVVIPIGKLKNGMPVGVQIHARKWFDFRLLQIAQELERCASR
ncbi:MAG: amidase [Bacteroidetes bacterium]|nr:MAG: amidase [Bacteroidota bacterium]